MATRIFSRVGKRFLYSLVSVLFVALIAVIFLLLPDQSRHLVGGTEKQTPVVTGTTARVQTGTSLPQRPTGTPTSAQPTQITPTLAPTLDLPHADTSGPVQMALSAQACAHPIQLPPSKIFQANIRPTTVIGGGEADSGDYTFGLWLYCMEGENNSDEHWQAYTSLRGLGIHIEWAYKNSAMNGWKSFYVGLEPYLAEGDGPYAPNHATSFSMDTGFSFWYPPNITFDLSAPETPLRFILKGSAPTGGFNGAALSFTLRRVKDGFFVIKAETRPLDADELTDGTGTIPHAPVPILKVTPAPTQPPITDEQVLARAVMKTDQKSYCSWQVMGQAGNEVYAWAYCAVIDGPNRAKGSMPALIRLDGHGHFAEVQVPGSGPLSGPQSRSQYAGDLAKLFPPEIQQLLSDPNYHIRTDMLEQGIQMRLSGQINAPYVLPGWPSSEEHCQWNTQPLRDLPAADEEGYAGWMKYSEPGAGFTLNIPPGWSVDETLVTCWNDAPEPHFLFLESPEGAYRMAIGFRRPDQNINISSSGVGSGELTAGGTARFFGKPVEYSRLVYGGRTMALLYKSTVEFLANKMFFSVGMDIACDPKNDRSISAEIETLANRILASAKPYSPAAPFGSAIVISGSDFGIDLVE